MDYYNAIQQGVSKARRDGEQNRLEMMQENWEVYYGRGKKPLKVVQGAADDNVTNNFGKMIVDKGVAFLFGKEIQFDITASKKTDEEEWLDACWQENRKMSLLQKLALTGAVCGTAFIRIHYAPGMEYPRLILLDPETIRIVSAEDDIENIIKYVEAYPTVNEKGDAITIRRVYEKQQRGWTIDEQRGGSSGGYTTTNAYAWNYDFAPIIHCQNLANPFEIWGEPDLNESLKQAILTNDFIWSNARKIIRHHAHPKTVVSGIQKEKIKTLNNGVDDMIILEDAAAKINNLEMQSELISSLEFSRRQIEFIHELSRVPEIATGKVESVGQFSGIALEILYQPLLEKTEAKRITYGEMIVELNRRLLAVAGKGDNHIAKVVWQELLPKDAQLIANAALVKNQLGVSKETLVRELGDYDPDEERVRWQNEQDGLGAKLLQDFDRGGAELEA